MADNDRNRIIEKIFGEAEPYTAKQDGDSPPDSILAMTKHSGHLLAFLLWTVMSALLLHYTLLALFPSQTPLRASATPAVHQVFDQAAIQPALDTDPPTQPTGDIRFFTGCSHRPQKTRQSLFNQSTTPGERI